MTSSPLVPVSESSPVVPLMVPGSPQLRGECTGSAVATCALKNRPPTSADAARRRMSERTDRIGRTPLVSYPTNAPNRTRFSLRIQAKRVRGGHSEPGELPHSPVDGLGVGHVGVLERSRE